MEVLHWRVFWSEVWMGNLQGQYLWVFLLGLVRFPREVILISCQNGTVFVTSILKQEEEKLGAPWKKSGAPADRLCFTISGWRLSSLQYFARLGDGILDCFLNSFQPIFILVATFIFISRNTWYSKLLSFWVIWGYQLRGGCTLTVSFLGSVKSFITGPSAFQTSIIFWGGLLSCASHF